MRKFRKGAASFYIVSISTLILVIIAASFIGVIISEVTRTSNDDLAQSAYDSALAGVEDAKLAYYSYQNCKNGSVASSGMSCVELVDWVENGNAPSGFDDCDMVSYILGRNAGGEEIPVQEGSVSNNMQQAYTCVMITNTTDDVLGSLSESNPEYTVRIRFNGEDEVNVANEITRVRVKWHLADDGENWNTLGKIGDSNLISFTPKASVPAVLAVGMVQTSVDFNLSDFDMTKGLQTNRGTVYLVPHEYDGDGAPEIKTISARNGFLKSNDKVSENTPHSVECSKNNNTDYACEVDLEIPKPINHSSTNPRNSETFMFKVALPYGKPSTSFSLEFFCDDADGCPIQNVVGNSGDGETTSQATLKDVQIKVDSTGRANDLYRRVEMRLEAQDVSFPYPLYTIQALGADGGNSIIKNLSPTREHGIDSSLPY